VSKAELERLRQGPPPPRADKKGVLADYDLIGGSGPVVADLSGNGRAATIHGDVTRSPAGLVFGGKDGRLDLPDALSTGLSQLTVSAQVSSPGGNWHTVTGTLSNGSARLFDDAVEFARVDGVTGKVEDLLAVLTTKSAGARVPGKMRRLTVWNRVLTPQEVLTLQRR
jgi:hypothetical protein